MQHDASRGLLLALINLDLPHSKAFQSKSLGNVAVKSDLYHCSTILLIDSISRFIACTKN
mgnify:CR=1 FL=1